MTKFTIKDLYNLAKQLGCEDYEINILYDCPDDYYGVDYTIEEEDMVDIDIVNKWINIRVYSF